MQSHRTDRRILFAFTAAVLGLIASGLSAARDAPRAMKWWSLQPVKAVSPPLVDEPQSATRNPIDAFVLKKLTDRGLGPAPPADRRTLIRRLYFDLIGLPPRPEEVEAFGTSADPKAYEKLVDRLLADPGYGERWARHWLDVVRYGESQGFERDHLRPNAWPYRDYVIRAFNDDKPYDRFVVEQLAGDVLKPATRDAIAATGFLSAGPWDEVGHTSSSPSVKVRARDEELEEIIGTVSQTFLGLTANCARCHDHKFDPIPQRDYYRLRAVFEGVRPGERPFESPEEQADRLSRAGTVRTQVEAAARIVDRLRQTGYERAAGSRAPSSGALRARYAWTFEEGASSAPRIRLVGNTRAGRGAIALGGADSYAAAEPITSDLREKTLEVWVTLANLTQRGGSALTIQTPDGSRFDAITFGERQPRKWAAGSESFRRTKDLDGPDETDIGKPIHLAVTYAPDGRIMLYRNGEPYGESYIPSGEPAGPPVFRAGESHALFGLRHTGARGFLAGSIEEARIHNRALNAAEVAESYRAGPYAVGEEAIKAALTAGERAELAAAQGELESQRDQLRGLEAEPMVYAVKSVPPPPTRLLLRGDPDKPADEVTAGGLSFCGPGPEIGVSRETSEGERRLALARWITDRRNPLTARVMVNRVWQHHFGSPLAGTPNDFGAMGERPTHPELLDWLARKFMESGWRLKSLHRLILCSAAYRQSSRYDPKAAKVDAGNRWLWRYSPRRLEGEVVRDAMLSVAGRLNSKRGGPSFRPFTVVVDNSSFYTLVDLDDPELDRRTVYRMNIQGARMPLLETLDCPDPSTKTPRRNITTTALQALELMNSRFVTRMSGWFAARAQKEAGGSVEKQVERAFRLAYGRAPAAAERQEAVTLARAHGLRSVTWALFNSSEFLYAR